MASGLPVLPDSRLQVRVAWLPSITVWSTPAVACSGGSGKVNKFLELICFYITLFVSSDRSSE